MDTKNNFENNINIVNKKNNLFNIEITNCPDYFS